MTVQQLKYIIKVAELTSITEASKQLHISQPSLSGAIKDVEKEIGITIFQRSRLGVVTTPEGLEFLGYARQVVEPMEQLEHQYIGNDEKKQRFCEVEYTVPTRGLTSIVSAFSTAVRSREYVAQAEKCPFRPY